MVEPVDEKTAGLSRLRASHADREQVIDALKTAFVQGRLARDELGLRVGQALASRTYADLAALTADIPAEPADARPLAKPARKAGDGLALATIARVSASGGVAVMAFTSADVLVSVKQTVAAALAIAGATGIFVAGLLAALLTFLSWAVQRRARRASPIGPPALGGQAAGPRSAATRRSAAGQVPSAGRDPRRTAQATPPRRSRPALASAYPGHGHC